MARDQRESRIEVEPLIPLDVQGIEGMTIDEFVERNRKAIMVLLFQRAFAGDRESVGLVGKVVTAPYTERTKLLAMSGGKAVGMEGVGGPLGALMRDLQIGKVKMDDLVPDEGERVPARLAVEQMAPGIGRHDLAVGNAERRSMGRSPDGQARFTPPKGMVVEGEVM